MLKEEDCIDIPEALLAVESTDTTDREDRTDCREAILYSLAVSATIASLSSPARRAAKPLSAAATCVHDIITLGHIS